MRKITLRIDRMITTQAGPDPDRFARDIEQSLACLAGIRRTSAGSGEAQRVALLAWEAVQRARTERRKGG